MGCIASKNKDDVVPVLRRRLSLGEIGEGTTTDFDVEVTEADRSLLVELSQQQVFDFVQTEGRRYSLGSQTGTSDATSFSSKSTRLDGEVFDPAAQCIGYACKKGLKPEAPNQDSFLLMRIEGKYALYGVFDGHGRKGHDISNFVKDNLPKVLFSQRDFESDPEEALRKTFAKTQILIEKATAVKSIDATRSGTTCSVVLHLVPQQTLYIAHVGDSRVVLGKKASGGQQISWEALDLTIDHKPDLPEERERIEKNGGMVVFDGGWNYRVFAKGKKDSRGKRYPGLNMSRAMGDLTGYHDAGISAAPDVSKQMVSVQPIAQSTPVAPVSTKDASGEAMVSTAPAVTKHSIQRDSEEFILMCSDGVWEFITSQAAVQEVAKFDAKDAPAAAEHLASMSWEQWMSEMDGQVVDDITVLLIHL